MLGSLSKTYAMTGWRAGFALGPKPIIAAMSKLQSQSTSSTRTSCRRPPSPRSTARRSASPRCARTTSRCATASSARLAEIPGLTCTRPEGAFYVYPNVSAYLGKPGAQTAMELAGRLLHEAHVVTVPGEAFGTNEHIRLSYAVSHDDVEEGVKRMKAVLREAVDARRTILDGGNITPSSLPSSGIRSTGKPHHL